MLPTTRDQLQYCRQPICCYNRLPDTAFSKPSAKQLSMMCMLSSTASLIASISLRLNSCSTYDAMSICPSGRPMPAAIDNNTAQVS